MKLALDGKTVVDGEWPSVRATARVRSLIAEDGDLAALYRLLQMTEDLREAILGPGTE